MFDLDESFFFNLRSVKRLYDADCIDQVLATCGDHSPADFEFYELAWEIIDCIFEETRGFYNEEREIDAYVFFDPLIDEFCHLMLEYEKRHDLPLGDSDYRKNLTHDIYRSFEIDYNHYDYGFRVYDGIHGRSRLVFLMGCEFCGFDEVPAALAEIKNVLTAHVNQLRKELAPKLTVIDGNRGMKEAA